MTGNRVNDIESEGQRVPSYEQLLQATARWKSPASAARALVSSKRRQVWEAAVVTGSAIHIQGETDRKLLTICAILRW